MLPAVLIAMFMAGFDVWAVNVAAPSLQTHLHVSHSSLQLIVGGYAFMYAAGMVTGGRLGDLYGYRRMFIIGVLAFAAASLLCAVSHTPGELVAARLFQGLTGAAMVPQVLALITASFPPPERAKALSWFMVAMGIAFVSGQLLGGGLLQLNVFGLGWRNIFLVNVPVGVVAAVVTAMLVPPVQGRRKPRLDPIGVVGVSAALALALVPLTLGHDQGWPPWTWASLAASAPLLLLTVAWERRLTRRGGEPLLDLSLFADRAFSAGLVVNFCLTFFWGGFMFVLTLLLQLGLGLQPFHAGVEFMPMVVTTTTLTLLAPRLGARLGARSITAGAIVAAAGTAVAAGLAFHYGARLTGWDLSVATAVAGAGMGLALPLLIGAALAKVRPERAGAAAGALNTAQQFGTASGIAVVGAVFYGLLGSLPSRGTFVHAMAVAMVVDAVLLVATTGTTLLLPGRKPAPRT